MIGSFLGLVVFPLVIAGLVRWAAVRRRRGLAAGRAVHFRGRLDGGKGRLLADPRLPVPVFLDRAGQATALPRGGKALDMTVLPSKTGQPAFEQAGLRYRTPDGATVRLGLGTHDARTVGTWLAEAPRPAGAPARLRLPTAPLWAVLALAASLLVALTAADMALLGRHTTAEVVRVHPDEDACTVRWDGGSQQATVDCDTATTRTGDREPIVAMPWPFLGEAVDTVRTPIVVGVAVGGFGLLGLAGALVVTPWSCARRVRRAGAAGPVVLTGTFDGSEHEEHDEEEVPTLENGLGHGSLAAVARHADRHRPGPRVTPPRRGPGRTSVAPRGWAVATVLGTTAWWFLALSVGGIVDDHFHLGHWRFVVLGSLGIVCLARIGWFVVDRSAMCAAVLRAVRGNAGELTWQPMRYVRLRRGQGETALVLFPAEGGEVAAPRYVQGISWCRGSERRTVGGPGPVGKALVHDTGVGPLVCEIDGVRYLPRGRAVDIVAEPARGRQELLDFAESHRRPVGRG